MITKLLVPIAGMVLAACMVNARAADPIALTGVQMDAITAGEFIQPLIFTSDPGVLVGFPFFGVTGTPGFSTFPFVVFLYPGTVVAQDRDGASVRGPDNTGASALANALAAGQTANSQTAADASLQEGISTSGATSFSTASR